MINFQPTYIASTLYIPTGLLRVPDVGLHDWRDFCLCGRQSRHWWRNCKLDAPTDSNENLCDICLTEDGTSQWPSDDQLRVIIYRVPAELLIKIILSLDLCSVVELRQTNLLFRAFIDLIPAFRSVVQFPKLIGAVLQLRCRSFDLQTVRRCRVELKCSYCGFFGDIIYLITAERWCYSYWAGRKEIGRLLFPQMNHPVTKSLLNRRL